MNGYSKFTHTVEVWLSDYMYHVHACKLKYFDFDEVHK